MVDGLINNHIVLAIIAVKYIGGCPGSPYIIYIYLIDFLHSLIPKEHSKECPSQNKYPCFQLQTYLANGLIT